jgi:hypothetical protein
MAQPRVELVEPGYLERVGVVHVNKEQRVSGLSKGDIWDIH